MGHNSSLLRRSLCNAYRRAWRHLLAYSIGWTSFFLPNAGKFVIESDQESEQKRRCSSELPPSFLREKFFCLAREAREPGFVGAVSHGRGLGVKSESFPLSSGGIWKLLKRKRGTKSWKLSKPTAGIYFISLPAEIGVAITAQRQNWPSFPWTWCSTPPTVGVVLWPCSDVAELSSWRNNSYIVSKNLCLEQSSFPEVTPTTQWYCHCREHQV